MRLSKQTSKAPEDVIAMALYALVAYIVPKKPKPAPKKPGPRDRNLPTPLSKTLRGFIEKAEGQVKKHGQET